MWNPYYQLAPVVGQVDDYERHVRYRTERGSAGNELISSIRRYRARFCNDLAYSKLTHYSWRHSH
jgi:hypothetical protein